MWFVFRRSRKTNHVSSLLRERSARKTSVFNQKTMFLGYAHSSNNYMYSLEFFNQFQVRRIIYDIFMTIACNYLK
ncbi:MAG: hypothetical protein U5L45_07260 [Saprospiraceae bacterium]|nr:hypothetical protein [Saprospiraceae bacterium]